MLLGAVAELDGEFAHFWLLFVEVKFQARGGVVLVRLPLHLNVPLAGGEFLFDDLRLARGLRNRDRQQQPVLVGDDGLPTVPVVVVALATGDKQLVGLGSDRFEFL